MNKPRNNTPHYHVKASRFHEKENTLEYYTTKKSKDPEGAVYQLPLFSKRISVLSDKERFHLSYNTQRKVRENIEDEIKTKYRRVEQLLQMKFLKMNFDKWNAHMEPTPNPRLKKNIKLHYPELLEVVPDHWFHYKSIQTLYLTLLDVYNRRILQAFRHWQCIIREEYRIYGKYFDRWNVRVSVWKLNRLNGIRYWHVMQPFGKKLVRHYLTLAWQCWVQNLDKLRTIRTVKLLFTCWKQTSIARKTKRFRLYRQVLTILIHNKTKYQQYTQQLLTTTLYPRHTYYTTYRYWKSWVYLWQKKLVIKKLFAKLQHAQYASAFMTWKMILPQDLSKSKKGILTSLKSPLKQSLSISLPNNDNDEEENSSYSADSFLQSPQPSASEPRSTGKQKKSLITPQRKGGPPSMSTARRGVAQTPSGSIEYRKIVSVYKQTHSNNASKNKDRSAQWLLMNEHDRLIWRLKAVKRMDAQFQAVETARHDYYANNSLSSLCLHGHMGLDGCPYCSYRFHYYDDQQSMILDDGHEYDPIPPKHAHTASTTARPPHPPAPTTTATATATISGMDISHLSGIAGNITDRMRDDLEADEENEEIDEWKPRKPAIMMKQQSSSSTTNRPTTTKATTVTSTLGQKPPTSTSTAVVRGNTKTTSATGTATATLTAVTAAGKSGSKGGKSTSTTIGKGANSSGYGQPPFMRTTTNKTTSKTTTKTTKSTLSSRSSTSSTKVVGKSLSSTSTTGLRF